MPPIKSIFCCEIQANETTQDKMNEKTETRNMALFCDFENVALGVRDAKYAAFDIQKVLERLLLKGSIVVKKAYCDWDRYKEFKAAMHEAAFELIEIPHVRQSGKNSADIRMVVDALDLCYTKSHVDIHFLAQYSSCSSSLSFLVSTLPIRECVTRFFNSTQMLHLLNNPRADTPEEYSASAIMAPPKTMSTTEPEGHTASPNKGELSIILSVIHLINAKSGDHRINEGRHRFVSHPRFNAG
jgi:hypothetical protein